MVPRLSLDVLVPTHNRASLLDRSVRSVLAATPSPHLDVHVTVICNACTDGTHDVVGRLQSEFPGRITRLIERRQGKSKALNAGIARTSGDLVGMIDDDEEVGAGWLQVAGEAFQDDGVEFVGGPYLPVWESPPPAWLPADYVAVIGAANDGGARRPYGHDFPGMLKGGNAIIRRATLRAAGPYAEYLGPGSHARLFSCEDEDMYFRLLERGARGEYLPDLVVYHYIAETRLSREYYRKWCFWRGVSLSLMERRRPLPVTYVAGVPRFMVGSAIRALARLTVGSPHRPPRQSFEDQLRMWDLAGYVFGRHIYSLARFSPVKSRRRGGADAAAEADGSHAARTAATAELAACSTESRQ